ncbi:MAG: hypothetical protein WCC17_01335, partial [Candidatus Nitrosopolaris sp.]
MLINDTRIADLGSPLLIQTNTTIGAGQNITGSLSLRNMLAKTAGSEVHVSLANASTIAEKT